MRGKAAAKKTKAASPEAGIPVSAPEQPSGELSSFFGELIDRYERDPLGFVEDILGGRPKAWQRRFLRHVGEGKRRISIKAGHGVGKSTAVAWVLIWSACCRFPQKSVVTAPTAPQLFDALFAELKSWVSRLPPQIKVLFNSYSDRVELKAAPDDSFISARTSNSDRPEAMSGVHSAFVLLVADEAPGIPEAVFENSVGSMSGPGATMILVGNPTRLTGLFWKTHNDPVLAPKWERMTVSCLDPDLDDLVDKEFIQQVIDTYGEGSDQYRVRVLGEFPKAESNTLIPLELVESAMKRDIALIASDPIVYGVDVARTGPDRSTLCKRQGNVVLEVKVRHGNDLMETTGWVAAEAGLDRPSEIMVDTIGLGAGVADRLRELGFNVRDVNVAEASPMNPQASRLRDELWLSLRDWLNQRACRLPADDGLKTEISAPLFGFLSNGKYKIEGKEEMKKRLKRSPDLADALCLTFAGQAALVGGRAPAWIPGKPLQRSIAGII